MTPIALLQQQQASHRDASPVDAAWRIWDAAAIATAASCPLVAVRRNWPRVYAQLEQRDGPVVWLARCAAAIATIAIETASTFEPVREAFWTSEDWRRANLSYWPFYGRGFIQLTWQTNYATYGRLLGVALEQAPDLALEPDAAAAIFAEFFVRSGAAAAADRRDWAECRRRVQGGDAGLDRLVTIVGRLGL